MAIIEEMTGKGAPAWPYPVNYGKEIEKSLKKLQDLIWQSPGASDTISSRFYALKLLEKDEEAITFAGGMSNGRIIVSEAEKEIERLEKAAHRGRGTGWRGHLRRRRAAFFVCLLVLSQRCVQIGERRGVLCGGVGCFICRR